MQTQKISLPIGFQVSIQERSSISAAISNLNTATRYMRTWLKYCKENSSESNLQGLDYAISWGLKYKNEFYAVEHLAHLYKELWQEKYCKAKLTYENTLQKCEQVLNQDKK
jgi:hypothetical protein